MKRTALKTRTPINRVSTRALSWKRWERKNYDLLAEQMRYGAAPCEGCGALGGLEIHHVAGRACQPFSGDVACLVALCSAKCHPAVTGALYDGMDGELRDRLRDRAIDALNARYPTPYQSDADTLDSWITHIGKYWDYDRKLNALVLR